VVGPQPAAVGAGAFVPHYRPITLGLPKGADVVGVAPEQRAGGGVFGDQRIAVVEEAAGGRSSTRVMAEGFVEPAQRIVAQLSLERAGMALARRRAERRRSRPRISTRRFSTS
jgi:hypothetical protein